MASSSFSRRGAGLSLLVLVLAVGPLGCGGEEPLRVGFIGGLTGRVADLGTSGRDGAVLAVEEQNARGGVRGRLIRLLVRDDGQNPEFAAAAARDLVGEGVVALLGPMTSSMAVEVSEVAERHGVLCLSPTAGTAELSRRDDRFFRIYPGIDVIASDLARHVFDVMEKRRAAIVLDMRNEAYCANGSQAFQDEFRGAGGTIVGVHEFRSGDDVDFLSLAREATKSDADVLFVLASALDCGMICQQVRKIGSPVKIVATEWSTTDHLISFGGRAVEGLFALHTVRRASGRPEFESFRRRYAERFGQNPSFSAMHAYDAARILFAALEREPSPEKLPETLRQAAPFEGLASDITFDAFGDVERSLFPIEVRNGVFRDL